MLKYTKAKVPHTQDKHTQLSSLAELSYYPIKSLAESSPPPMLTYTHYSLATWALKNSTVWFLVSRFAAGEAWAWTTGRTVGRCRNRCTRTRSTGQSVSAAPWTHRFILWRITLVTQSFGRQIQSHVWPCLFWNGNVMWKRAFPTFAAILKWREMWLEQTIVQPQHWLWSGSKYTQHKYATPTNVPPPLTFMTPSLLAPPTHQSSEWLGLCGQMSC